MERQNVIKDLGKMHFQKHQRKSRAQVPITPRFGGQEGAQVSASIYITGRLSARSVSWH